MSRGESPQSRPMQRPMIKRRSSPRAEAPMMERPMIMILATAHTLIGRPSLLAHWSGLTNQASPIDHAIAGG